MLQNLYDAAPWEEHVRSWTGVADACIGNFEPFLLSSHFDICKSIVPAPRCPRIHILQGCTDAPESKVCFFSFSFCVCFERQGAEGAARTLANDSCTAL